ncbi:Enoyl-(Acyl carrier protein) reductase-like protein 12 [Elsinoe fawcettii]|nr:Enoyl-(Acyl carrier protein) reductase-like protein 12 [Elsinoe fawcettii]
MAAVQKVALITAGTAGLGAQIARVLAPDYRVVINYANNASRAQSLITDLSSIPSTTSSPTEPRFHAIQADVGSRPAIESLVSETIRTMGRLDVVVSNAGWTRITNFFNIEEQLEDSDWDKCFLYNVKAHLWLAYAAKDALKDSQGAFITTASIAGVKPSGSSLPYAVTKAAAIHLSKSLANIMAPDIRVNSVSPGLLLTEWGMKFPEEKREKSRKNTKLGRLATVEDVADQVAALARNQSMTGQNILLDSGMSL